MNEAMQESGREVSVNWYRWKNNNNNKKRKWFEARNYIPQSNFITWVNGVPRRTIGHGLLLSLWSWKWKWWSLPTGLLRSPFTWMIRGLSQ